jgi:hypothetical protein
MLQLSKGFPPADTVGTLLILEQNVKNSGVLPDVDIKT